SYSHLTGLEEQVKSYEEKVETLEDEVAELNEKKLSATNTEINAKEGWKKAEAKSLALKNHLEFVTLTVEDQASQLDGALKECMRQIRNLKEERELKIQNVILATKKTSNWTKFK
ncbi:hypothetical protein RYX36_004599, partial [Vicia faba]